MRQSSLILRGVVLACAMSAASLPALAKDPGKQAGPARWYTGDSTQQQRKATLKKEINAAYAEQTSACKRASSSKRSACLTQARQTYQHDMANVPKLLAQAPTGEVSERIVSTSSGAPDTPRGDMPRADMPRGDMATQNGASAYGSSGGGATGSGSDAGTGNSAGHVDAIPPSSGHAGMPPPVDQPNPVQPLQPQVQGATPPIEQQ